jgi:hypothetical protein
MPSSPLSIPLSSHPSLPAPFLMPQWPLVYLARPSGDGSAAAPGEPVAAEQPLSPGELCIPLRQACKVVWQMTEELLSFTAERTKVRRDNRRQRCHVRQISMYVCHVALRIPQSDVAYAFGRDRTTIRHACASVEDRRDNAAYDQFVSCVERLAVSVFQPAEGIFHD